MNLLFLTKARMFLLHPYQAFEKEKETKAVDSFKYALEFSVILGFLSGIMSYVFPQYGQTLFPFTNAGSFLIIGIVINIISSIFIVIVGMTFFALWLHLWALVFGAKNGLKNTQKSVFFGAIPVFVLGWIPLVSIIGAIWSLVLTGIGLHKNHGISGGRVFGIIFVSVIIPIVISLMIVFMSMLWMYSML